MADLIDRDSLLLKQKAHADLFANSTVHDDIVRRDEATAALAEIINAPAVNRWIPVSERLPEKTGYYLVCDSNAEFDNIRGRREVAKFVIGRHGGHWYGAIRREYITHWMPLPEPPKEDENE